MLQITTTWPRQNTSRARTEQGRRKYRARTEHSTHSPRLWRGSRVTKYIDEIDWWSTSAMVDQWTSGTPVVDQWTSGGLVVYQWTSVGPPPVVEGKQSQDARLAASVMIMYCNLPLIIMYCNTEGNTIYYIPIKGLAMMILENDSY